MNEFNKCPPLFMMAALSTTIFSFPVFARQAEDSPLLQTYRENRLDEFKHHAVSADVLTLERYLELAVNQQRREYADFLIAAMPDGWNADELAEKMMARGNLGSLNYFLPYTTPSKHAGWLREAAESGDRDLAGFLERFLKNNVNHK